MQELMNWALEYVASQSKRELVGSEYIDPYTEYKDTDEFGRLIGPATALVRHETFYLCVQALCYIHCFYGRELTAYMQQESSVNYQDQWQIILTSELEPMKYCLHSVRYEFLKFARNSELINDNTLSKMSMSIEVLRNKLKSIISEQQVDIHTTVAKDMQQYQNPLDSFFPFDPCLLMSLNQYVERFYRVWKGVPLLDLRDNADDEEYDTINTETESELDRYVSSSSVSNSYTAMSMASTTASMSAYSRSGHAASMTKSSSATSVFMDPVCSPIRNDLTSHSQPLMKHTTNSVDVNHSNQQEANSSEKSDDAHSSTDVFIIERRQRFNSITSIGSW